MTYSAVHDIVRTDSLAFASPRGEAAGTMAAFKAALWAKGVVSRNDAFDPTYALVAVDVDDFTRLSAAVGDSAARQVLDRLVHDLIQAFRPTAIARVGGDEVLFAVRLDAAEELADFLRRLEGLRSRTVAVAEHAIDVTCCAGVSAGLEAPNSWQAKVDDAFLALARAKRAGRGSVRAGCRDTRRANRRRLRLQGALRHAVLARNLEVRFQPIVDCATRRNAGAEALLRWTPPDGEPVSPAEFIPIAEASGLHRRIGDQVVRAAAEAAQRWQAGGKGLKVAVNVSPLQLEHTTFARDFVASIDRAGCPRNLIGVEVTETAALTGSTALGRNLDALAEAGIDLAIDDFGTGYASLEALVSLPVSTLKIDRCFVAAMTEDRQRAAVVRSSIRLAHDLGLRVVAEGVETEEQFGYLRAFGCDFCQGFLFGRAVPPQDIRRGE